MQKRERRKVKNQIVKISKCSFSPFLLTSLTQLKIVGILVKGHFGPLVSALWTSSSFNLCKIFRSYEKKSEKKTEPKGRTPDRVAVPPGKKVNF